MIFVEHPLCARPCLGLTKSSRTLYSGYSQCPRALRGEVTCPASFSSDRAGLTQIHILLTTEPPSLCSWLHPEAMVAATGTGPMSVGQSVCESLDGGLERGRNNNVSPWNLLPVPAAGLPEGCLLCSCLACTGQWAPLPAPWGQPSCGNENPRQALGWTPDLMSKSLTCVSIRQGVPRETVTNGAYRQASVPRPQASEGTLSGKLLHAARIQTRTYSLVRSFPHSFQSVAM